MQDALAQSPPCPVRIHAHPDLELGDLTIEVSGGEALAQQFHAMHLCLDTASAVMALNVLAYNIKRTASLIGFRRLIQAIQA